MAAIPKFSAVELAQRLTTATKVIPAEGNTIDRWRSTADRTINPAPQVNGLRTYWQLSFGSGGEWLGGCLHEVGDAEAALVRATALGLNKGGEVLCIGFRAQQVDRGMLDRSLTAEQVWNMPEPPGMEALD